jgi:hypothetical protein
LKVAHGNAVFGGAAERAQVDGADIDGCLERFEGFFGFLIEGWLVGGEGDAAFSGFCIRRIVRR